MPAWVYGEVVPAVNAATEQPDPAEAQWSQLARRARQLQFWVLIVAILQSLLLLVIALGVGAGWLEVVSDGNTWEAIVMLVVTLIVLFTGVVIVLLFHLSLRARDFSRAPDPRRLIELVRSQRRSWVGLGALLLFSFVMSILAILLGSVA